MGGIRTTMGCCHPKPPEGAGDEVGTLYFEGSGFCGCSKPWSFHSGGCCGPSPPDGPEWSAAYPGFEKYLAEVDEVVDEAPRCCGGPDFQGVKAHLDSKWLPQANEHLAKHGLVGDLYFFWTYNGQSSQPHLWMRIYTKKDQWADSAPGRPPTGETDKLTAGGCNPAGC